MEIVITILTAVGLVVGVLLIWLGWYGLCVQRGWNKLNYEQRNSRIHYQPDELYRIGNPFDSYKGRSNW